MIAATLDRTVSAGGPLPREHTPVARAQALEGDRLCHPALSHTSWVASGKCLNLPEPPVKRVWAFPWHKEL